MDRIAFLLDSPKTADGRSRVQIAKTGKFRDPRYGKFAITADHFASWVKNFSQFHASGAGLPVDVDHSPEKRGQTEAAGWVKSLDTKGPDGTTSTPDQLWAEVEWNSLGQQLIEDRRYLYLSPSYQHNFADETGKKHGTALVGVGMTNRPFLTMATVSLSEDTQLAVEEDEAGFSTEESVPAPSNRPVLDSPGQMELTKIIEALTLSSESTEDQIVEAIKGLQTKAEKSPEEGQVVLSSEQLTKLTEQATAGEQALSKLNEMTFDSAYDKAMSEGKVGAGQREAFKALFDADSANTLKLLDGLEKAVSTDPAGTSGEPAAGTPVANAIGPAAADYNIDEARSKLLTQAEALAAERKIDILDAAVMIESGEVQVAA